MERRRSLGEGEGWEKEKEKEKEKESWARRRGGWGRCILKESVSEWKDIQLSARSEGGGLFRPQALN
eukprot:767933-Hanusia_phi.AAC.3